MEKLYVNEIRPDGEVSTVGLFYSRGEAESIVAQLQSILEKQNCRYEITETISRRPSKSPRTEASEPSQE
jgi:hypothetical protein